MSPNLELLTLPSEEDEEAYNVVSGNALKHPALHARFHHLWPIEAADELEERDKRAIDLYLGNFCAPVRATNNEIKCNGCGTELLNPQHPAFVMKGMDVDPASPTLESKCPVCAYPVRARHLIYDLDGKRLLVALNFFPLCYHPVNLT